MHALEEIDNAVDTIQRCVDEAFDTHFKVEELSDQLYAMTAVCNEFRRSLQGAKNDLADAEQTIQGLRSEKDDLLTFIANLPGNLTMPKPKVY
jgi:uncharacterized coiled-coil DUF342 family protein